MTKQIGTKAQRESTKSILAAVTIVDEVYAAFKYYLKHFNGGRPVVLAGFSQGAMIAKELLKRMTPEEYDNIAAAGTP